MATTPKIALFPGTFDPITNGHLDVIERAEPLFDQLIVAVGRNPDKNAVFQQQDRVEMIREILKEKCPNVVVQAYQGLTVEFAHETHATVILRGLRNVTDLHHEFQLALTNRAVGDIETVFIMTGENFGFTSSSLIKQIAAGGQIDRLHALLPELVVKRLKQMTREQLLRSVDQF
ncbi:MAG: pantetheine-phosphate adenylyltransferase [Phycisphaeraceae bacterium]|nr:pantetheine-phosphate adenylyltransferase [Phycisphaeraceae bacterium]